MRDTLQIEALMYAFDNYTATVKEEDEARKRYEGRSWGYHGRYLIEAKEAAAEEIQKRLNEYIDARIELRIK